MSFSALSEFSGMRCTSSLARGKEPWMYPNDDHNHCGGWSNDDLRKAENTASLFLEENGTRISATLRAKTRYMEGLIHRLSLRKTTLDQRLDCFARIAEMSELLKQDAEGFFELASQPVVARILSSVKRPQ